MKINIIKTFFAIAIGALVGYICKIIAADENQWYSFAVASVTIIGGLIAAFASYPNVSCSRQANTKVTAWILAIAIAVINFIFAFCKFCNYKHETYIVVMALLLIIDLFIVYILARKKE